MGLEGVMSGFDIPGSGLMAERIRMNVIAENVANAYVTRTPEGGPYVRRSVTFAGALDGALRGVQVVGIEPDQRTPFVTVQEPGHRDADAEGNVRYPNVNVIQEMVDFNIARRSYEANLAVFRAYTGMVKNSISNISA
jgi:flagellar basal-body rod protein FlgC